MTIGWKLTVTGIMAAASVWAQTQWADTLDPSRGVQIQGEISSSGVIPGLLTVELSNPGGGLRQSAMVNSDGTFEFRSATPGMNELRVTGAGGAVIHQEIVFINGPNQRLSIRLASAPRANRAAGDTVSLQQLEHKVPAAARRSFDKGVAAARKKNLPAAAAAFRKAVETDPEFADAYNELGSVEVSMDNLPEAASSFQKAIDLAPEHRLALPNLSIVLARMKQYKEAADVARRALKVQPGLPKLRYILAVSLIAGHGDTEEAMTNLRRVEADIPKAHLLEAQVLADSGKPKEAAEQVEEYLRKAPNDAERGKIEAYLADLQHQSAPKE